MASQNRPASKDDLPDPAGSYERAKPENEAGMGRLDTNRATPAKRSDQAHKAVKNRQPSRQINAHDVTDERGSADPNRMPPPEPADHSMKEEEPLGWDQAPQGKTPDRDKRHPKTGGKGGTPDA